MVLTVCALVLASTALAQQPAPKQAELPPACQAECASQYGVVLGQTDDGTEAYSNCRSDCVVFEPHHHEETYTGIKWQCVEYARRWLLRDKGVVFGDVDIAADIWNVVSLQRPDGSGKREWAGILNGADAPPRVGDALIYDEAFEGTGHVAIVVRVDITTQQLFVAEQNYLNAKWPADYARAIDYVAHKGRYWVLDPHLIGWKRVES
jgi:glutathionylspermidine amidase/synthetase